MFTINNISIITHICVLRHIWADLKDVQATLIFKMLRSRLVLTWLQEVVEYFKTVPE